VEAVFLFEVKPARYHTTNWSDYNAALRKRGSLLIWLDKEMAWHAPREGRPGRPPVFSNAAIQFDQSAVQASAATDRRDARQSAAARGAGLARAGLFDPVPQAE
jgi:hypothetical protein